MNAAALQAPAGGWKVPGWATPHNLALIVAAAVVAVVLIGLVRAVGKLAGVVKAASAPAPAPKPSGKGTAFLIAGAAAAGGWLLWKHGAAAGAKAAPAPAPQPAPTVTVTAPPKSAPVHFTWPHIALHLTGTQWTVIVVVALLVAFAIVRPLLHRSAS